MIHSVSSSWTYIDSLMPSSGSWLSFPHRRCPETVADMTRIHLRRPGFVALLLAVGIAACESRVAEPPEAQVRDSLGVRIVESAAPTWESGSGWRLSDDATLEIGSLEGDPAEQFSEVIGATRLEDGRWVIADGATSEIRVFDADGAHEATLTRQGRGPQELLGILSFQRLQGDVLVVQEAPGTPRHAFLDADGGRPLRRIQLSAPREGVPFAVVGWVEEGTAVISESPRPSLRPGEQATPTVTFSRVGPEGTVSQEITSIPGSTLVGRERGPPVGVTMGGRLLRHVRPDGLILALPEGADVRLYQLDGTLPTIMRREMPPVSVDGRLRAEYIEAHVAGLARSGAPPEMIDDARQQLEGTNAFAERVPTYSRVLTDAEGNVWVREWVVQHALPQMHVVPTFERPDRWSVFDPTGRWLGHVETPASFFVFEIGADYAVGLHRGELDVERVRVHELMKP
jgi:hypothetical protein